MATKLVARKRCPICKVGYVLRGAKTCSFKCAYVFKKEAKEQKIKDNK